MTRTHTILFLCVSSAPVKTLVVAVFVEERGPRLARRGPRVLSSLTGICKYVAPGMDQTCDSACFLQHGRWSGPKCAIHVQINDILG